MAERPSPRLLRPRPAGRWVALLAFTALALFPGSFPLPWAAASPFVSLGSVLAARPAPMVALLGIPVAALVFLRPRWFCRHACPVGFLQELLEGLRPRRPPRWRAWPPIGHGLAWLGLGAAAMGSPLFLWFDPLAIFSGFVGVFLSPPTAGGIWVAAAFPVVVAFDLLVPGAWCRRVCPLGATQDLVRSAGALLRLRGRRPAQTDRSASRRGFLLGCAGAACGLAVRRAGGHAPPLRPPGVIAEDRFTGVCIRCGSCARACPARILSPDPGRNGVAGWLAPVVDFSRDYCREGCNRCSLACPSGAIRRFAPAEKRGLPIGIARVDLGACLLANGQDCTACVRACPYEALAVRSDAFDTRPALDRLRCTGCGACECACPATPRRAITVVPDVRAFGARTDVAVIRRSG